MNVQVSLDESVKDVVAEAVLRSLDDAKREVLVKGAIQHLLTSPGDRQGLSPIVSAFRLPVERLARELMEAEVNKPEVRAKFQKVIEEAVARGLEQNREKTIEKIGEAVFRVLYADGRY